MTELVRQTQLDRDKAALADPQSAKQVMEIARRSSALHKALKGMKGYEEEYYKAFDVMIEAYRIVGQELRETEDAPAGRPPEIGSRPEPIIPTLADLGITKKQSYEWQTIALLPRTEIEDYIQSKKEERDPVTKTAILELANNYKSAQQRYDEEMDKVIATMGAFIIQARRVITHRLKYGDVDMTTKEGFLETSRLCEEILNELNRTV